MVRGKGRGFVVFLVRIQIYGSVIEAQEKREKAYS